MGRPAGSKNKPKTNGAGDPSGAEEQRAGPGHNSELSDDQRQALFWQHKRDYVAALAAKKKADADLKNVAKRAKAELGDTAVADIKLALELETKEGETAVKARMEAQARVLRWLGLPLGTQTELFPDVDPRPSDEVAAEAGKRSGLAGEPCQCPHDASVPQYKAWMDGWQEGQKVLLQTKLRPLADAGDGGDEQCDGADGEDVRPRFLKNGNGGDPEESARRRKQEHAVDDALADMAAEQAASIDA